MAGNKRIYRDIEISFNASLHALAEAIVHAFDFSMDHAFGFYATDKPRKYYEATVKYELFADMEETIDKRAKSVKRSKVSEAFTHEGQKMIFLFDYGDNWLFELEMRSYGAQEPRAKYPRVLVSRGTAPSQYGDFDEEEEG